MRDNRFPWGALAIALWFTSLLLPCVMTKKFFGSGMEPLYGVGCLVFGMGTVPWYANVFVAIAAIGNGFKRYALGLAASLVAIITALFVFAYSSRDVQVTGGYFVWLASFVVAFIASVSGLRAKRRARLAPMPEIVVGDVDEP